MYVVDVICSPAPPLQTRRFEEAYFSYTVAWEKSSFNLHQSCVRMATLRSPIQNMLPDIGQTLSRVCLLHYLLLVKLFAIYRSIVCGSMSEILQATREAS